MADLVRLPNRALSSDEKLMLNVLQGYNGPNSKGIFPGLHRLADQCSFCLNHARDTLKSLAAKGVVGILKRKTEAGDDDTNLYTIHIEALLALLGGSELPRPGCLVWSVRPCSNSTPEPGLRCCETSPAEATVEAAAQPSPCRVQMQGPSRAGGNGGVSPGQATAQEKEPPVARKEGPVAGGLVAAIPASGASGVGRAVAAVASGNGGEGERRGTSPRETAAAPPEGLESAEEKKKGSGKGKTGPEEHRRASLKELREQSETLWQQAWRRCYEADYTMAVDDGKRLDFLASTALDKALSRLRELQAQGGPEEPLLALGAAYLRHLFGAYLANPGSQRIQDDRGFLRLQRHPLRLLVQELHAYRDPWFKQPTRPRPSPSPSSQASLAEQAALLPGLAPAAQPQAPRTARTSTLLPALAAAAALAVVAPGPVQKAAGQVQASTQADRQSPPEVPAPDPDGRKPWPGATALSSRSLAAVQEQPDSIRGRLDENTSQEDPGAAFARSLDELAARFAAPGATSPVAPVRPPAPVRDAGGPFEPFPGHAVAPAPVQAAGGPPSPAAALAQPTRAGRGPLVAETTASVAQTTARTLEELRRQMPGVADEELALLLEAEARRRRMQAAVTTGEGRGKLGEQSREKT